MRRRERLERVLQELIGVQKVQKNALFDKGVWREMGAGEVTALRLKKENNRSEKETKGA
jgi:hypothetical protein